MTVAPLVLISVFCASPNTNWTGWRGPDQNGISPETGYLKKWPREGLRELWRMPLGAGFASFVAVGDRVYTLTQARRAQRLVAIEGRSGKRVWSYELESAYKDSEGDGPRATPTVKANTIYAIGAKGTLAAVDLESGKKRWAFNVLKRFGAKNVRWGLSASPYLYEDTVVIPVGAPDAGVVALDSRTGDLVWKAGSAKIGLAGYSTPYEIHHGGEDQLIVFMGRALVALGARDGETLWTQSWRTSYDVNASSPIYHDGDLFVSSGYGRGSALLRLPRKKGGRPKALWESRVLRNKFSSCVLSDGKLYGFDENHLKCVDFRTAKEHWRKPRVFGHGTVLLADGHLIVLGDRGDLALIRATPKRYEEVARMKGVLDGRPCWTVPVLHQGILYLRNLREAVALDLRGAAR